MATFEIAEIVFVSRQLEHRWNVARLVAQQSGLARRVDAVEMRFDWGNTAERRSNEVASRVGSRRKLIQRRRARGIAVEIATFEAPAFGRKRAHRVARPIRRPFARD